MSMTLLLALAFQVSTPALDAEAREHNCTEPMTQMDMNACEEINFQRADLELNQVWREALAEAHRDDSERTALDRSSDIRPGYVTVLRGGQRAWLTFRDQHCTWEGYNQARGGSMEPMVYSGCRTALTRERIAHLRGGQQER